MAATGSIVKDMSRSLAKRPGLKAAGPARRRRCIVVRASGVPRFNPRFEDGPKPEPIDLIKFVEDSSEVNERVHIVAFRAEGVERSGLYSLKSLTTPPFVHKVVCFECYDDAQDCAEELANLMPNPRAESCATSSLVNMCIELGYGCELHLAGSNFEPPKFEEITDWERASRLRQGQFKVMDHDPPVQK